MIVSYCKWEGRRPFTQNDHYFLSSREKALERSAKRRRISLNGKEEEAERQNGDEVYESEYDEDQDMRAQDSSDEEFAEDMTHCKETQNTTASVQPPIFGSGFISPTGGIFSPVIDTKLPQPSRLTDNQLLSVLAERGYYLSSVEDLIRLQPPDDYSQELRVIAEVKAYFKAAYKRIIDVVPMVIESTFLEGFATELGISLIQNLGLIGEGGFEKCVRYASDGRDIEEKRTSLRRQLEILTQATCILHEF